MEIETKTKEQLDLELQIEEMKKENSKIPKDPILDSIMKGDIVVNANTKLFYRLPLTETMREELYKAIIKK